MLSTLLSSKQAIGIDTRISNGASQYSEKSFCQLRNVGSASLVGLRLSSQMPHKYHKAVNLRIASRSLVIIICRIRMAQSNNSCPSTSSQTLIYKWQCGRSQPVLTEGKEGRNGASTKRSLCRQLVL